MAEDVVIRIRAKNLTKAEFEKARRQLDKIGKQAGLSTKRVDSLGTSFKKGALQAVGLGSAMGVAAIAAGKLVGAVSDGVRGFVSFEKSMLRIETLVGVAREEVESMKDSVRGIAAATGRGPQELAEAMFQITSAGLRGKDALIALEASAKGAALGLGDTSAVADAATSIVNAYGVENINAAQAVDVLTATVRLGKKDAGDFAGALGTVIPIASTAGVAIQEVGTAMAILTRSGASASEAATQVAGIIRQIVKPTVEARDALATAGLTMDDVRESIREKGLLPALQELREQMDEEAFIRFAGRAEAINAALGVTGIKFKETSAAALEMEEAFGLVQEAMKRLGGDASFRAERVSVAWDNAAQKLGKGFVGVSFSALEGVDSLQKYADEIALAGPQNAALASILKLFAKEVEVINEVVTDGVGPMAELEQSFEALSGQTETATTALQVNAAEMTKALESTALARVLDEKAATEQRKVIAEVAKSVGMSVAVFSDQDEAFKRVAASMLEADKGAKEFLETEKKLAEQAAKVAKEITAGGTLPGGAGVLSVDFESARDFGIAMADDARLLAAAAERAKELGIGVSEVELRTLDLGISAEEYNEKLRQAADLAQIIPGILGEIVSQSLAASASLQNLGALKDLKFGGEGGSFFGGLAGAAGILGPLAGLGSSIVGAISGLFGRDAKDAARDVGRDIGAQISEGLAEQILQSGQNAQLFLNEIFAEGNLGIDRLAEEVGDLFSFFDRGEISKGTLIAELKETLPLLIQNFQDLGPAGEEQIARITAAAAALGIELDEIDQLMQAAFAPDTLETIAEQFNLTNEQVRELGEKLGIDIQTNLQRMAADVGLTTQQFKELGKAVKEEYGLPLDQIDELLASMGVSAEDLATALNLDLGDVQTGAEKLGTDTTHTADEGKRFADEMERAMRAIGNMQFPSIPGGFDFGIPMAHGGFGEVTRPTTFVAGDAGREGFAFFPGGLPQGGGGDGGASGAQGGATFTGDLIVNMPPGTTQDHVETFLQALEDNTNGVVKRTRKKLGVT